MNNYEEQCFMIAEKAFHHIAEQFPSLSMVRDKNAPVEIYLSIPAQPGNKHGAILTLQNRDELHFSVSNFHLVWAPCIDPSKVEAYIDAAVGFLGGRYRIVEHYRGKRFNKAVLQSPIGGQWETIGVSYKPGFTLLGKKTIEIIKN